MNLLQANRHQRIEDALAAVELGDKRPSQLVTVIRRRFVEVGLQVDDNIVKSRLLTALPPHVRSALVGHDDQPVDRFAQIADSMLAVAGQVSPFSSIARTSDDSRQREDRRSRPFTRDNRRQKVCNGHIFYGVEARTCRPWCQWPGPKPRMLGSRQTTPDHSRSSSPSN